jgi:hypothetical protein
MSANTSLGRLPPRLGSSTGARPVLRCHRSGDEVHPGVVGVQPRGGHHLGLADLDVAEALRRQVRLHRRAQPGLAAASVPTTKRRCRWPPRRGGMALTGCSRVAGLMASTSSVFQAITRSAGVRPGSPQSASTAGSPGSPPKRRPASASRTLAGIGRRAQRRHADDAAAVDQAGDGVGQHRARVAQQPAPVAAVVRAFAQLSVSEKLATPREPRKSGRPLARQARAVAGDQHVGARASRCAAQNSARPGEPVSSPVSSSQVVEAQPAAPRASTACASAARLMLCWPLLSAVPRP